MRLVRSSLTAVLAIALAATSAQATTKPAKRGHRPPPPPKPVCTLISDQATDGNTFEGTTIPKDDKSLDVVSADLAMDAQNAYVVFRLKTTNFTTDTMSPGGHEFNFNFSANKNAYTIYAVVWPATSEWANVPSSAPVPVRYEWQKGTGTGFVNTAKHEIHVTVPLAKLSPAIKPGTLVSSMTAQSRSWIGVNQKQGVSVTAVDSDTTTKTYVAGYPSCISPGGADAS